MKVAHVVGVDPGLVDTGVVRMLFNRTARLFIVEHTVVTGIDPDAIAEWILQATLPQPLVFIEAYNPRGHFRSDSEMVRGQALLKQALPHSKLLPNFGIKKVVSKQLMELLGVWTFPQTTHHQDLRSAARIGLMGMMLNEWTNMVLSDVIRDALDGNPWQATYL